MDSIPSLSDYKDCKFYECTNVVAQFCVTHTPEQKTRKSNLIKRYVNDWLFNQTNRRAAIKSTNIEIWDLKITTF